MQHVQSQLPFLMRLIEDFIYIIHVQVYLQYEIHFAEVITRIHHLVVLMSIC